MVLNVAIAVWLIGFRGAAAPPDVLPDTTLEVDAATAVEFSLDLAVATTLDHELVYAVEQRARPAYRIFSLDPSTGEVATVFAVPEDAIVYGIALSPDRTTLAVAYTPDFNLEGSGLWTLDVASGAFEERRAVTRGLHVVDLSWSEDGEQVLATEVDRRGEEQLSGVVIDAETGDIALRIDNAISPVEVAGGLHYLRVGPDKARRSIGVLDAAGVTSSIELADEALDLDHLTAVPGSNILRVAVLDLDDGGVSVGSAADAHGSHDVPSSWFEVAASGHDDVHATGFDPIIVFDAAATDDSIVYATKQGLSIATDRRIDVIASRAIRFVAA